MRKLIFGTLLIVLFTASFSSIGAYAQNPGQFVIADSGSSPAVCPDLHGGFYVAWQHLDDAVHLQRYDSLGQSIDSLPTSFSQTAASLNPSVAMKGGNVVTVWMDRLLNTASFYNTYIVGNVSSPGYGEYSIRYNDVYFDAIRGKPDICFLTESTYVVVWQGNGPSNPHPVVGIYGQVMSVSGQRIGRNILVTDHTASTTTHISPRVLPRHDSSGFTVFWADNSAGHYNIYERRFNQTGAPIDSSVHISTDSTMTDMYYFDAREDTAGDILVVWNAEKPGYQEMEGRWIDRSGAFNGEIAVLPIPDSLVDEGSMVDITMGTTPKIVLTWNHYDPTGDQLFGCLFDYDFQSIRRPFLVDTSETGGGILWPRGIMNGDRIFFIWEDLHSQGGSTVRASAYRIHSLLGVAEQTVFGSPVRRSFELLQNYPNPFNPTTKIRFTMASPGHVALSIWNTLGLREAVLLDEGLSPGTHEVTWDGKTSNGTPLPSGTYFVSVRVGGEVQVSKLVLLR